MKTILTLTVFQKPWTPHNYMKQHKKVHINIGRRTRKEFQRRKALFGINC